VSSREEQQQRKVAGENGCGTFGKKKGLPRKGRRFFGGGRKGEGQIKSADHHTSKEGEELSRPRIQWGKEPSIQSSQYKRPGELGNNYMKSGRKKKGWAHNSPQERGGEGYIPLLERMGGGKDQKRLIGGEPDFLQSARRGGGEIASDGGEKGDWNHLYSPVKLPPT